MDPDQGPQADVSYVWSVRTIWGMDGYGARQQAVSGNNVLATFATDTHKFWLQLDWIL